MALPADFSKIFGSTATGGLTPIGDVDYAKGWEFVGSNPPTKNDFTYLQYLSDQKAKWLYDNNAGRLIGVKTFNSSGTYTPTPGTKSAIVEVQGAGGGGGSATGGTTTSAVGASGGAGAYALSFLAITSGTASIVVGAGGAPSGEGGTSSFSGFNNTIIAAGGGGGVSTPISGSASSNVHVRGAGGGKASGGNIVNGKGGTGTPSFILAGTPSGGAGGDSHFSGGALGAGSQGGAGGDAVLGAGGSGATVYLANATYPGGYGGDGIVIIWEYA